MDTNALRKGFGSASGRNAQIAAYHAALNEAADEIDKLREERERVRAWIESTCPEGAVEEAFRQDPEQTPNELT